MFSMNNDLPDPALSEVTTLTYDLSPKVSFISFVFYTYLLGSTSEAFIFSPVLLGQVVK